MRERYYSLRKALERMRGLWVCCRQTLPWDSRLPVIQAQAAVTKLIAPVVPAGASLA
jgi:hypothetical protein